MAILLLGGGINTAAGNGQRSNYEKSSARKKGLPDNFLFSRLRPKPTARQRVVGPSRRAGRLGGRVHPRTTTMHATRRLAAAAQITTTAGSEGRAVTRTVPTPKSTGDSYTKCAWIPSGGPHLSTPAGDSKNRKTASGCPRVPGRMGGLGGGSPNRHTPPSTPPSRANGDGKGGGRRD